MTEWLENLRPCASAETLNSPSQWTATSTISRSTLSRLNGIPYKALYKHNIWLEPSEEQEEGKLKQRLRSKIDKVRTLHDHADASYLRRQIESSSCNEPLLKFSIMRLYICPDRLPNNLQMNIEQPWTTSNFAADLRKGKYGLPRPEPHLALAFSRNVFRALQQTDFVVPDELENAMFPTEHEGAFPFLFLQVHHDFEEALRHNCNNAAQALRNMLRWYDDTKSKDVSFLRNTRIITLSGDRTRLVVRLHRASRPPERPGETLFFFSDLVERKLSSEDEGCHILHAIVEEYVLKMLLPSLDDVVCEVIGEYENELK